MRALREFTSADELRAFYRGLRARLDSLGPPPASPPLAVLVVPPPAPPPATLSAIVMRSVIDAAAAELALPCALAFSADRKNDGVTLRQVIMLLAREFTALSFPQIGKMLGGRDHTTVVHGYSAIQRKMAADPVLAHKVTRLRAKLKEMVPMRYGKIDAIAQRISVIEHGSFAAAKLACGLGNVDSGALRHEPGVGGTQIVVAAFGLFEPATLQSFFAVGPRLYAGNALLLACDGAGNTVDIHEDLSILPVRFFDTAGQVERAIRRGEIARPTMSVNGATLWQWPDPRPDLEALAAPAATRGGRS